MGNNPLSYMPTLLGVKAGPAGFRKTLQASDFMDIAGPTDVSVFAGKWIELGNGFTIPAAQQIVFGYGKASEPQNQGYIYVSLIDDTTGDATQENGLLRFTHADPNRRSRVVVFEMRTEELDGDANDKAKRIPLPEIMDALPRSLAKEDGLLILEFKSDATDILQPDYCVIRIPATAYYA
ncbi:MAG: hypothetical protein HY532_00535 [Chloroflexi bacterium]|nr:hypothetical protein [Chloroflexota bacterium]